MNINNRIISRIYLYSFALSIIVLFMQKFHLLDYAILKFPFLQMRGIDIPVNQIFLDGYICKPPVYRKTPLGREIADVLLAVNRPYGKSDYIPCICWGRNARYASAFEVGGHVLIWGRIQSREYMKRIGENETEKRVAYEVSVSKIENVTE